jgi:hypothetical protein
VGKGHGAGERETRAIDALHFAFYELLDRDGLGGGVFVSVWVGVASERSARLFDALCLEEVLHDLEVGDKLVLVLRVHLDARHRHVACPASAPEDRGGWGERTVDGVEDLAVGRAGAALLDLCVVELEQVVEPAEEL